LRGCVAARGTALFAEPHEAEIIWAGKTYEVANVLLPFQSIEQID
jgi:adenine-specific DNA-methyltransferase